jgi:hypothetical protein
MSKKKTTPGNVNLKARGLIGHLVPLTLAQRRLIIAAAGLAGQRSSAWSALALEQSARQVLTGAGVDPQTYFEDS